MNDSCKRPITWYCALHDKTEKRRCGHERNHPGDCTPAVLHVKEAT